MTNKVLPTIEELEGMTLVQMVELVNLAFLRAEGDGPIGSENSIGQWKLVREEFKEIEEALAFNIVSNEFRDGIADTFTVLLGFAWRASLVVTEYPKELYDKYYQKANFGSATSVHLYNELKSSFEETDHLFKRYIALDAEEVSVKNVAALLDITNSIQKHFDIFLNNLISFAIGMDIPIYDDLASVTFANLSKICSTEDEVKETIAFYAAKGVELVTRPSPVGGTAVFTAKESVLDGKTIPANKFLKNINWKEPVFKVQHFELEL